MTTIESEMKKPKIPEGYFQRMGEYLRNNPEEPIQSREISARAANLVITHVSLYPQVGGSVVTIAESLINQFDPNPHSDTGIGIMEMAYMYPNPILCAQRINKIHKSFRIPRIVTPAEAGAQVSFYGLRALELLREATVFYASDLNYQLPPDLVDQSMILGDPTKVTGPWSFNRQGATQMYEALGALPKVRKAVRFGIQHEARLIHANSRAQQRAIVYMANRR